MHPINPMGQAWGGRAGARLGVAAVCMAGGLIAAPPAVAGSSSSISGTVEASVIALTVHAHNTGVGTAATGTFEAYAPLVPLLHLAIHIWGHVPCLDVRGNRAGYLIVIDRAESPLSRLAPGEAILVTVVDNGPGKPEQIGETTPFPMPGLTVCPPLLTEVNSTSGRIVVQQ